MLYFLFAISAKFPVVNVHPPFGLHAGRDDERKKERDGSDAIK